MEAEMRMRAYERTDERMNVDVRGDQVRAQD